MRAWQAKLCSVLLILILLAPEILWQVGAQPSTTDEEKYYRCKSEECLSYQPSGSMPGRVPSQVVERIDSYRTILYTLGGFRYDKRGRSYVVDEDKLFVSGRRVYGSPYPLVCPNAAWGYRTQRQYLISERQESQLLAVAETPGPNTIYVAIGGHSVSPFSFRGGLWILSLPSTTGALSEKNVKAVRVPGSETARFSYWVESDGKGMFFWLSTLGIWAVNTSGDIVWRKFDDVFTQRGVLVYGGGKLLYYSSSGVFIFDAQYGWLLGNYSINAVKARYSPKHDAFIVVAANGTVYKIASPPVALGQYGNRITDYILLDGAGSARIEDRQLYINDTPTGVTGVIAMEAVEVELQTGERAFVVVSSGVGGTYLTMINGGVDTMKIWDHGGSMLAVHQYDNGTMKVATWNGWGYEEFKVDLHALLTQEKKPFVAAQGWTDETWVTITSRKQAATFVFDKDGQAPGSAATEVVVKLGSLEQSGQPERLNLLRDVNPLYVDFYSASGLLNWIKVAEASSFWNTSLRNGLTVNVRLDGYWYSTLYQVPDSVPVASLGIFWLYEKPITTTDYEEVRILANIQGPGMDTRTDAGIAFGDLVLFFSSSIGFYKLILKPVVFELPKILTRSTSGEVVKLTLDTSRRTIESVGVESKGRVTISRLMDAVRSLIKRGVPGEKATGAVVNAAREAVKQDIAARVSKAVYT
ncbi:MAG: hypothetical protein QXM71_09030, partial [Thermofilum sp.]